MDDCVGGRRCRLGPAMCERGLARVHPDAAWRNPTAEQGGWDLDSYAARVSAAIDSVREVTGSPDVNLIGFCAGGIIATTLLNHLAATGDERVHSVSYAVTLLDFGQPAPISAFSGSGLLGFARRRSRRKGIITSRQMGAAFTWMRPDDLVFNYWVNNYLMGERPRHSTSSPGTPTAPTCPARCTASSSTSSRTTCSRCPVP